MNIHSWFGLPVCWDSKLVKQNNALKNARSADLSVDSHWDW